MTAPRLRPVHAAVAGSRARLWPGVTSHSARFSLGRGREQGSPRSEARPQPRMVEGEQGTPICPLRSYKATDTHCYGGPPLQRPPPGATKPANRGCMVRLHVRGAGFGTPECDRHGDRAGCCGGSNVQPSRACVAVASKCMQFVREESMLACTHMHSPACARASNTSPAGQQGTGAAPGSTMHKAPRDVTASCAGHHPAAQMCGLRGARYY